jgi:SAM-dependent methyltransferase
MAVINRYSRTWFESFLDRIPAEVTNSEVAFLERVLPLPNYRRVLDVCCGSGRHAVPLTAAGYSVTGLDRDPVALQQVEESLRGTGAHLLERDMRDLSGLPGPLDAAIIMWQSFGYFDPNTNGDILRQLAGLLRPGGRLVLDLYHRDFFEAHPGTRLLQGAGRQVEETRWMEGDRLHVRLDYGAGELEHMEWQLFTPEEIASLAEGRGFHRVLGCRQWDEDLSPSSDVPRMQVVLQKR